jgi:hypothetical protein
VVAIACVGFIGLVALLGYATVSAIGGHKKWGIAKMSGLIVALGLGELGILLFWASLAGAAPSQAVLSLIAALGVGATWGLWRAGRLATVQWPPKDWRRDDWLMLLPMTLAAVVVVAVAIGSVGTPLRDGDGRCIWGLKAKVVYFHAVLPKPEYFHDLSFSFSHLDYPLMQPFLTGGVYAAIGEVRDDVGKLTLPLEFAAFGLLLYAGARWRLGRVSAALLVAIAMALPEAVNEVGTGKADLAVMLFQTGVLVFLVEWIQHRRVADLCLATLFTTFLVFTKNEGMGIASIDAVVLAMFTATQFSKRLWIALACAVAAFVALDLPWLIFNADLPRTFENYGGRLTAHSIVPNLPRLKQILPAVFNAISEIDFNHEWWSGHLGSLTIKIPAIDWSRWGGWWALMAVSAVVGWRAARHPTVRLLWLLATLQLGMYIVIYIVTPWDVEALMSVTLGRLLMQLLPATVLLTAWHWGEVAVGVHQPVLNAAEVRPGQTQSAKGATTDKTMNLESRSAEDASGKGEGSSVGMDCRIASGASQARWRWRTLGYVGLVVVATFVAGKLLVHHLGTAESARSLILAVFKTGDPRVMTDYGFVYTPYPRDVALAANDGSLLLRFHDFHERDHFVLSTTYFGFVYSLYPKRAYVADHTRVINNGFDILEADFSPDGEWLEQHDVRSIVHFLRRPDDTAEIRLQRLIQTSQDGRPKGVRN